MHAVKASHMVASSFVQIHGVAVPVLEGKESFFNLLLFTSQGVDFSFPHYNFIFSHATHLTCLNNKLFVCLGSVLVGSQVVKDALDVDLSDLESPFHAVAILDFYLFLAAKQLDAFE